MLDTHSRMSLWASDCRNSRFEQGGSVEGHFEKLTQYDWETWRYYRKVIGYWDIILCMDSTLFTVGIINSITFPPSQCNSLIFWYFDTSGINMSVNMIQCTVCTLLYITLRFSMNLIHKLSTGLSELPRSIFDSWPWAKRFGDRLGASAIYWGFRRIPIKMSP